MDDDDDDCVVVTITSVGQLRTESRVLFSLRRCICLRRKEECIASGHGVLLLLL